ncbi:MAG: adenylyltransferase/cytidyltransferase family protein, partial [Myxococcales bacterium]|nr:adenylyltransferase/cytidyltransferase family protein [Myxococcales bacterium]
MGPPERQPGPLEDAGHRAREPGGGGRAPLRAPGDQRHPVRVRTAGRRRGGAAAHAARRGFVKPRSARSKLLSRERLVKAVRAAQRRGETVVFTNGCFDLLHVGHVRSLEQARALGDRLLVAVNGDASVRRLKGPSRPLVTARQRMEVLAGLECVDWVTGFTADTPLSLIRDVRPDVLAKG